MRHFLLLLITLFTLTQVADAQQKVRKKPVARPAVSKKAKTPAARVRTHAPQAPARSVVKRADPFQTAFNLYKNKQYAQAATGFFEITKTTFDANLRSKAKLYLGISLYRLKLYQVAAFSLMEVVSQGDADHKKMATDYLVATANVLNEPSLLSFALKQATNPASLSETAKGVFEFRKAEALADEGKTSEARVLYERAINAPQTEKAALYSMGLLHLKSKNPKEAVSFFEQLHFKTEKQGILNVERGLAIMGIARSYYQARDWEKAALYYRMIPKDHSLYRQSIFELSWALFRSGKFRSAMSPLQTLHSPFYENFYQPESLMLRGVILLFICRFDEIDKILENYSQTYLPATKQVEDFLNRNPSSLASFQILNKAYRGLQRVQKGLTSIPKSELPFFLTRTLLEEHRIKRLLEYFDKVMIEGKSINTTFLGKKNSDLRRYAIEALNARLQTTREKLGKMTKELLGEKLKEMKDISTQMDFLKYETLGGKRDQLRKKMSVAHVEGEKEALDRSFLIQNGYRIWPFEGEYWRDEIGNYQYVGGNSCE